MDIYHSIVFVGACVAFFAMYRLLSWFINRRYYISSEDQRNLWCPAITNER